MRMLCLLLVFPILLLGCGSQSTPEVYQTGSGYSPASEESEAEHLKEIIPAQIQIPSLGLKADIVSLGLTDEGAMDVPKNDAEVGWFSPGYRPGMLGHAVLAGHVDSKEGPAVFFDLIKLQKGDFIVLTDADGIEMKFQVIQTEKYPYKEAPLKEIFGPSTTARLNLITCTGLYSRSQGTHQERLVVTAELIEPEPA